MGGNCNRHTGARPPARRRPRAKWLAAVALNVGLAGLANLPLHAAGGLSPVELAQRINPSPGCTQSHVVGVCYCGYVPCGYWLEMYVPAAFVETVVRAGDTLLAAPDFAALLNRGAPLGAPFGAGSSALSTTDNSAESRVWRLNDQTQLLSRLPPCVTCRPSDAQAPALAGSGAASSSAPCDPAGVIAAEILGVASRLEIPAMPSLMYASELDLTNWRTGCRDLSLANALRSNGFTCSAAGIAQWLSADTALGRLIGADACVGRWGPLYPRQMRDIGNNPVVHSVKTGYRALSIARDQLGVLPIPVDLAGRMQQAYPKVSACFAIGTLPLPEPPWSSQPAVASPDGRYGWIYWRPVLCCVRYEKITQCLNGGR